MEGGVERLGRSATHLALGPLLTENLRSEKDMLSELYADIRFPILTFENILRHYDTWHKKEREKKWAHEGQHGVLT